MAKRKQNNDEDTATFDPPRRSTRQKVKQNVELESKPTPISKRIEKSTKKRATKKSTDEGIDKEEALKGDEDLKSGNSSTKAKSSKSKKVATTTSDLEVSTTRRYWLMKAEPETRIEDGHDVRFSIDDLAAKTEPEPWDGIRAYAARNNLRAMKKGDLAFFYHSNCKVPGIIGIMEIVREHSPDLSAHDPSKPYYDASSKPEDPKWSVVHVEFRQKFDTMITLREMKDWQKEDGHPLKEMQMLKLSRMSVSKVTEEEWEYLIGEAKKRGDEVTL